MGTTPYRVGGNSNQSGYELGSAGSEFDGGDEADTDGSTSGVSEDWQSWSAGSVWSL